MKKAFVEEPDDTDEEVDEDLDEEEDDDDEEESEEISFKPERVDQKLVSDAAKLLMDWEPRLGTVSFLPKIIFVFSQLPKPPKFVFGFSKFTCNKVQMRIQTSTLSSASWLPSAANTLTPLSTRTSSIP